LIDVAKRSSLDEYTIPLQYEVALVLKQNIQFRGSNYPARNASTGSIVAARRAGAKPATKAHTASAKMAPARHTEHFLSKFSLATTQRYMI
jgi:hypothetical protein